MILFPRLFKLQITRGKIQSKILLVDFPMNFLRSKERVRYTRDFRVHSLVGDKVLPCQFGCINMFSEMSFCSQLCVRFLLVSITLLRIVGFVN